MQTVGSDRARTRRVPPTRLVWWEWVLPLVIAIVILGPALRPGVIFNLDLILTPHLDTPSGFWGLGPELPRRLPLWLPISWLSPLIPATTSGKLLMIAVLVVAWVGMVRLTRRICIDRHHVGYLASHAAGALYTLSPFVLTRVAVGHFNVTVPHAVLPWVIGTLIRPGRRLDATFLACFAMGFAGHSGGALALLVVGIAVVAGERERWMKAIVVALAAQAPWLVPGLVVLAANPIHMATGNVFPTRIDGLAGFARIAAGGGFWNTYFQIGGDGLIVAASGAALLTLAVVGTKVIASDARTPIVAIGFVGWFLVVVSTIRGFDTIFFWVNDHLIGGVWRESHRLLTLHLLWLAPAAALGGERLYRMCLDRPRFISLAGPVAVLPAAIAIVLAVPGVWGLGTQVSAAPLPQSWQMARTAIRDQPGTVLALPWYQYFNLRVGDGPLRRVLNPLPLYLGGDVLSSSDNGLQRDVREFGDPREEPADLLIEHLTNAEAISSGLVDLGVRWIMVIKTENQADYQSLADDPGLSQIIDTGDIALYRVDAWPGQAAADGVPVDISEYGPAWATSDSPNSFTWARAGSDGWWQGTRRATITEQGLVGLPGGGGLIWNIATVPALLGQIIPTAACVLLVLRRRGKHHMSSG